MKQNFNIECIQNDEVLSDGEVLSTLVENKEYINLSEEKKKRLIQKINSKDLENSMTKEEKDILDEFTPKNDTTDGTDFSIEKFISTIVSSVFLMISFGFFLYLIYAGQSRATIEYGISSMSVYVISFVIVILLAMLEGSQLAIVNLSNKDLSNSSRYPIAYEIQKLTKTKKLTQDYLVGRQLLVVIIVSIFSILTSFPNITNSSNTFIEFPTVLNFIIFKLGILNAFILLWFGQLIPQLFATKSPQTILNFRFMKFIVYICLLLSKMKIALPVSILVKKIKVDETMPPISHYESFMQESEIYKHYNDIKRIDIEFESFDNVKILTNDSLIVYDDVSKFFWYSLGINGIIDKQKIYQSVPKEIQNKEKRIDFNPNEVYDKNGAEQYKVALQPLINGFNKNDKIDIYGEYHVSSLKNINIDLNKPCRVVFIKIIIPMGLKEKNINKKLLLNHYVYNKISEEYELVKKIEPKEEEIDTCSVVKYAAIYPTIDSLFTISWEA